MSQNNKTRVPGMEYDEREKVPTSSVYSRGAYQGEQSTGNGRKTIVPGMENNETLSTGGDKSVNSKPIRGFLYSISRGIVGEFWPLHQGKNTIGSTPECDIYLPEATVSENHASITIRIMEKQGNTIAALKDTESTNGTFLNGEQLDFDSNTCKNGDVIRFGLNYECLLLLIDTKESGLSVAEKFYPKDDDLAGLNADQDAPICYNDSRRSTTDTNDPVLGDDSRHTQYMR